MNAHGFHKPFILANAKSFLAHSAVPISRLVDISHYPSLDSYFAGFKKYAGVDPEAFREEAKKNPVKLLDSLEKAKILLQFKDVPLHHAAFAAGYPNQNDFVSNFWNILSITAAQFQKAHDKPYGISREPLLALEAAKLLLPNVLIPRSDLVSILGYTDEDSFNQAFKNGTGVTPEEFRFKSWSDKGYTPVSLSNVIKFIQIALENPKNLDDVFLKKNEKEGGFRECFKIATGLTIDEFYIKVLKDDFEKKSLKMAIHSSHAENATKKDVVVKNPPQLAKVQHVTVNEKSDAQMNALELPKKEGSIKKKLQIIKISLGQKALMDSAETLLLSGKSAKEVAKALDVNEGNFSTLFKKHHDGLTPLEFRDKRWLEMGHIHYSEAVRRAMVLLLEYVPGRNVWAHTAEQVAHTVGFETYGGFSDHFIRETGLTISDYREERSARKQILLPRQLEVAAHALRARKRNPEVAAMLHMSTPAFTQIFINTTNITPLEYSMGENNEYIEEALASGVTLAKISHEFTGDPDYFSEVFKASHGDVNVSDFQKAFQETGKPSAKMIEAYDLLKNRSNKPKDVAAKLGYTNPESFNAKFKQTYGMRPKAFQKQAQIPDNPYGALKEKPATVQAAIAQTFTSLDPAVTIEDILLRLLERREDARDWRYKTMSEVSAVLGLSHKEQLLNRVKEETGQTPKELRAQAMEKYGYSTLSANMQGVLAMALEREADGSYRYDKNQLIKAGNFSSYNSFAVCFREATGTYLDEYRARSLRGELLPALEPK